jgi:hypothetical protein
MVHSSDTKYKVQLHTPTANFSSYQGGVYYASIKTFNTLSALTAELLNNKKHFISMQKMFLIVEFFHSINEYLNYQHEVEIEDSPKTKAL